MGKCFVYIQGFPRSGTTYLFRAVRESPGYYGIKEEQGLQMVWDVCRKFDNRLKYDDLANCFHLMSKNLQSQRDDLPFNPTAQAFWLGIHVLKNGKDHLHEFIDSWCMFPDREFTHYVSKTPILSPVDEWPEGFVKHSKRFDSYKVLCTMRDPEENYASGLRKFPFWSFDMEPDKFFPLWFEFYEYYLNKDDPNLIMVPHDTLGRNDDALRLVGKWLGADIPQIKFRSNRDRGERWLGDAERKRADEMLNAAREKFYFKTEVEYE